MLCKSTRNQFFLVGRIPHDPNKSSIFGTTTQASLPKQLKGYWPLIEACRLPQEVGISVTLEETAQKNPGFGMGIQRSKHGDLR